MGEADDKLTIIKSEKITQFFKSRPSISPEKLMELVIDLVDLHLIPLLSTSFSDGITAITPSNNIVYNTTNCENKIENILNKLNPTKEIIANVDIDIPCDFIIKNVKEPDLYIENRIIQTNISIPVIHFFREICKTNKANGILMSQHSGIIGKTNFEIEFIGVNIILYIGNVEYNEELIKIAQDIIFNISITFQSLNNMYDSTISDDSLNTIKTEYQSFISYKENLYNFISTTHSQIINKLNKLNLINTGVFLSSKFTQIDTPKQHICSLCNTYSSNSLKGIAAHKRGCIKKKH